MTGFSAVSGSWKIIAISDRDRWRSSSAEALSEVGALEEDLPAGEASLARKEADERPQGHRLPGAGLADEPERLAAAELEGGAVDRAHEAACEREFHVQVADAEDGVGHSGRRRSARPSAMSASPRAVRMTAMPGIRGELPVRGQVGLPVRDHAAPVRRRRLHTEAEVAERDDGEDGEDDVRHREDDRLRDHVRKHVSADDA